MSDGSTLIARDGKRIEGYEFYLAKLSEWFEDPSLNNYINLKNAAESVDSIKTGYWTAKSRLSSSLDSRLLKLLVGNMGEWGFILEEVERFDNLSEHYEKVIRFKEISKRYLN